MKPLLLIILDRKLKEINADLNIGPEEIKQTINELKFKTSGQQGIKDVLDFFKFGVPIKHEKERVVQYVQIFDYKNVPNNEFTVSRQVRFQNGDNFIKADIVLYVNGIPLVIVECKNPAALSNGSEYLKWLAGFLDVVHGKGFHVIKRGQTRKHRRFPAVQGKQFNHVAHPFGQNKIDA